MRKASLTIVIFCLSTAAMSQNLGARNTGMGDVSIGLRDAFSTNYNLYKLSSVTGFSIGISSQNLFLINELQKSKCALHFPIKKGGFGFVYEQYSYYEFNYHQISIAYGLNFNPGFSAGLKLNYTSQFLRGTSTAKSFLYPDLGICYLLTSKIELALILKNISLSGLEENSHIISRPSFLIAMLYQLNPYFNFHIESVLSLNRIGLRVGLEYHPVPSLYIRTGVNSLQNSVAIGLGMIIKNWGLISLQNIIPYWALVQVFQFTMKPQNKFLIVFLLFISFELYAQNEQIDRCIEWILNYQNNEENLEEMDIAQVQNELEYLQKNPVNINSDQIEKLLEFGILSQVHIQQLNNHIQEYGELYAIEELQQIDAFDPELISVLRPFIKTITSKDGSAIIHDIKESKNDLTMHYNQLLQNKNAYNDSVQNYLGHPSRVMIKFKKHFYNKWRIAVNLEKDAGEAYTWNWSKNQRLFDYSSFYIEYKSRSIIKKVLIGDYQLRFGQGLSFWKGFAFQKSVNAIGIRKVAEELKAHTGMDEFNFMRGLCAEINLNSLYVIPFFSYKRIDALLNDEHTPSVRSLQYSGLHRNQNEIERKANLSEFLMGFYLKYYLGNLKLGSTLVYQKFDLPFLTEQNLSNPFPFNRNSNFILGLDADYRFKNGHVFTELSRSLNGAIAYLLGSVITPDKKISISICFRNYPERFQAVSSNAFGESALNKNEKGFYLGVEFSPLYKVRFTAYYDLYTYNWTQTKHWTRDLLFSAQSPIRSKGKILFTYRHRLTSLVFGGYQIRNKIRFQLEHHLSPGFLLRYRMAWHHVDQIVKKNGYLFFADLVYHNPDSPFSFSTRYAIFNTDDYGTRIYAYERDAYFTYSVRPYYYKGQKVYLNVKYRMKRLFTFFLRYSHTTFPFLDELGSGNELITGNTKSEVTFQLRMRW